MENPILIHTQQCQEKAFGDPRLVKRGFKDIKDTEIGHISKVSLEFGLKIGGEVGIPYITKGTGESNLKITVECSFNNESEESEKKPE